MSLWLVRWQTHGTPQIIYPCPSREDQVLDAGCFSFPVVNHGSLTHCVLNGKRLHQLEQRAQRPF